MNDTPLPLSPLKPARVEAFVLRCPIATPVRTSFGVMHERPAVFIRVEDEDGTAGWGEAWCNFPSCGAEHRARLVETVVRPLLEGRAFSGPAEAFGQLTAATAVLAIQSGEPGPIAQAIAGVDLALWDLAARRAGQPLWRYLGGTRGEVPVYASGINPDQPQLLAARKRDDGFRAFKLKVGFGAARDTANLAALREVLGEQAPLMVDANQAWSLDEALAMAPQLERFDLGWLEEPLRADRPWNEWQALRGRTAIPLAAGENLASSQAYEEAIAAQVLSVLQPDAAKWGGISGCLPVARAAARAGVRYFPHYLGGGLGLLASAHLLAAQGGGGMLEVDANPNPLRSLLAPAFERPVEGECSLGDAPGLGVEPDLARLAAQAAAGT